MMTTQLSCRYGKFLLIPGAAGKIEIAALWSAPGGWS